MSIGGKTSDRFLSVRYWYDLGVYSLLNGREGERKDGVFSQMEEPPIFEGINQINLSVSSFSKLLFALSNIYVSRDLCDTDVGRNYI